MNRPRGPPPFPLRLLAPADSPQPIVHKAADAAEAALVQQRVLGSCRSVPNLPDPSFSSAASCSHFTSATAANIMLRHCRMSKVSLCAGCRELKPVQSNTKPPSPPRFCHGTMNRLSVLAAAALRARTSELSLPSTGASVGFILRCGVASLSTTCASHCATVGFRV